MTAVEWLYQILHEQNYIYEDMSEYLKQAKKNGKKTNNGCLVNYKTNYV